MHDAHNEDPTLAFQLAHLSRGPTEPTCIGVFREQLRPVYGDAMSRQIDQATQKLGPGDLTKLLHSGDTWVVN
jgi:2-oxoglutarate/2-oxoacid ferredoxin oxidoreductase subunit beta